MVLKGLVTLYSWNNPNWSETVLNVSIKIKYGNSTATSYVVHRFQVRIL